jgi:hypothetical protein
VGFTAKRATEGAMNAMKNSELSGTLATIAVKNIDCCVNRKVRNRRRNERKEK